VGLPPARQLRGDDCNLQQYNCIGDTGTVVVYNEKFERGVLDKLAEAFPEHESWIENAKHRVVDLLEPFQRLLLVKPRLASLSFPLPESALYVENVGQCRPNPTHSIE